MKRKKIKTLQTVGINRRFYSGGVGKGLKSYDESLWGAYEVPVLLALVTQVAYSYLMFYKKVEGAIITLTP